MRFSFAFFGGLECYGDISPTTNLILLPVIPKILPKLGPALTQASTHEDVGMFARLLILDAVGVRSVTGHLARREIAVEEASIRTVLRARMIRMALSVNGTKLSGARSG